MNAFKAVLRRLSSLAPTDRIDWMAAIMVVSVVASGLAVMVTVVLQAAAN